MSHRFKRGTQLFDIETVRQLQQSVSDEQISTLRGRCDRCLEFVDTDAIGREHPRDLVDDARMVLPDQFERDVRALGLVNRLFGSLSSNGQKAARFERFEVEEHCVDQLLGNLHQDDSSELSRKFCEMAAIPVSIVTGHDCGDSIDETRLIISEKSNDDGNHAVTLAHEVSE